MADAHLSTDRLTNEQFAPPSGLSALGDHLPFLTALAVLPSMSGWQLRRIADRAIECLDLTEPDADLEVAGDEADGTDAEDEIGNNHLAYGGGGGSGAGCPFSDPAEDEHDAEREEGLHGDYGTDQRIAAVGHGYRPWDIDAETWAGGAR